MPSLLVGHPTQQFSGWHAGNAPNRKPTASPTVRSQRAWQGIGNGCGTLVVHATKETTPPGKHPPPAWYVLDLTSLCMQNRLEVLQCMAVCLMVCRTQWQAVILIPKLVAAAATAADDE